MSSQLGAFLFRYMLLSKANDTILYQSLQLFTLCLREAANVDDVEGEPSALMTRSVLCAALTDPLGTRQLVSLAQVRTHRGSPTATAVAQHCDSAGRVHVLDADLTTTTGHP